MTWVPWCIKAGVDNAGVRNETFRAVAIGWSILCEMDFTGVWCQTAGRDGQHKVGSAHYRCGAEDWRSPDSTHHGTQAWTEDKTLEFGHTWAARLNYGGTVGFRAIDAKTYVWSCGQYDLVYHVGSHFHVEFDPKGQTS